MTLPRIVKSLKDLRCCDGDAATLECHVEGTPEPNVFWEKDGKILHEHATDYRTKFDGRKAILSILRVYPEDEGEYTLVAANDMGRAYSSACIIVDGKGFVLNFSNCTRFLKNCTRFLKIVLDFNYLSHFSSRRKRKSTESSQILKNLVSKILLDFSKTVLDFLNCTTFSKIVLDFLKLY